MTPLYLVKFAVYDNNKKGLNRDIFKLSFLTLSYLTLSLYVAFYISLKNAYILHDDMLKLNLNADVWLIRVLTQNGLALYLTWVTIATNLNMAAYITYGLGVELTISTSLALGVVFLLILVYFIVENYIWQRYLLYVFTPWPVVLFALGGSLLKNWPSDANGQATRNNILTLVMFIVSVILFIVKLIMFGLYQTKCKPSVDKRESHKLLQAKQNRANS
jgi:hypothetical protein